ncbi:PhoP regulatory network protein YrbL [Bordetella ansorpii]|uniref:PhoP regulatory network protein YrbL n=1 Tax=Bordetella ansorpii TaxID=288768 RepID=A0A157S568_9BORD|nr:YrbL family protein [Bordetella ansorpii]SAI65552.1 PhoP regulatory network protein YrbL [Bordetella ansorpii]
MGLLILKEKIGAGHLRECWRHPEHPARCIKIAKNKPRAHLQNLLESHYATHLQQRGVADMCLPRVHGWAMTDRGWGLILDLVVDAQGMPAPTLRQARAMGTVSDDAAAALLNDALDWLACHGVVWIDASQDNVVLQATEQGGTRLAFIDGLGGRHFDLEYRLRCRFRVIERVTARLKAAKHRARIHSKLLASAPRRPDATDLDDAATGRRDIGAMMPPSLPSR